MACIDIFSTPSCYQLIHFVFSHWCIYSALFSSAWLCQQSYCRGAGVRRPSVNLGFSENAAWIQAKFGAKLPIRHMPKPFFFFIFSKFLIFIFLRFFFSFSLTADPMGAQISKRCFSHNSDRFHPNFMTNMIVRGNICYYFFGDLQKNKTFMVLWNFQPHMSLDHMGLEFQNATPPTVFIWCQTLWGHWLQWWNTGYCLSWQSAKF